MKIKSYKKLNKSSYKIDFVGNEESVILYDDIILKYNLLVKKEFNSDFLQMLKQENASLDCYYKALSYLNYKSRSKKEVEKYLEKIGFTSDEIQSTIKRLEEKKIINDESYLKSFINDKIHLSNNGPLKIIKKLKSLGFQERQVKEYLETFERSIWREKIAGLVNKKIKTNRNLGENKLKEKILFSLLNEGFDREDVLSVLDSIEINSNQDILRKEARKYYSKLSKKYDSKELKYQLKLKLMSRGFGSGEINLIIDELIA